MTRFFAFLTTLVSIVILTLSAAQAQTMTSDQELQAQQTVLALLDTYAERHPDAPLLTALQCKTAKCTQQAEMWFDIPENANKRLLLLSVSNGLDCHACTKGISLAWFVASNAGWQLATLSPFIAQSGSYGDLSKDIQLLPVAADAYAIVFRESYTNQGITSSKDRIFLPIDGIYKQVCCDIARAYDNEGAGVEPVAKWESKLESLPTTNAPYDLRYQLSGVVDGRPVTADVVYTLDTDGYVTMEPLPSWLQQ
ncbi:MAG: hypothetical protein CMM93_00330 [Rickettsiales bacterium]|nr:hypothetical protein [Rickettsiales bacterium]|tara:strand:+ start:789 stop:1547 length:759 start_codon:yes stop_codon:yes gene_type:complete